MPAQIVVVKRPRGGLFALVRSVPAWLRAFWIGDAAAPVRRSTAARTTPQRFDAKTEGSAPIAPAAGTPPDEESLRALFPEHAGRLDRTRDGMLRLEIPATDAAAVLRRLREEAALGFDRLRDLTVVDRATGAATEPSRLEIVYLLVESTGGTALRVHVTGLDPEAPEIATGVPLWPGAEWLEREAYDLFGVRFRGHPGLQRILLPIDFDGSPLRKGFFHAPAERVQTETEPTTPTASAPPKGGSA